MSRTAIQEPEHMIRPIRLILTAVFVATAMALVVLASSPATAQAHAPASAGSTYTLYPEKWKQPTVSVWSNWNATVCTGAYSNPTGDPTPPLSPREMHRILSAVITQLNDNLDGALILHHAGSHPANTHCGQTDLAGGIFVGWSPLTAGIAGMAPLASKDGAIIGAGVVLNPILVCHDASQWIEFVLLHELMHALGIGHSPAPGAVMHERAGCDSAAVLDTHDVAALNAHYPAAPRAPSKTQAATSKPRLLGQMHFNVTDADLAPQQLIPRLATTGCEVRVLAIALGGRLHMYIVGAPSVVNAGFPTSLAAMTPFIYRCAS